MHNFTLLNGLASIPVTDQERELIVGLFIGLVVTAAVIGITQTVLNNRAQRNSYAP